MTYYQIESEENSPVLSLRYDTINHSNPEINRTRWNGKCGDVWNEVKGIMFWRSLISEFIATFFLIFIGCGVSTTLSYMSQGESITYHSEASQKMIFTMYNALIWCGLITLLTFSFGQFSCICNPAITVALFIVQKLTLTKALILIGIQLIASCLASFSILVLLPDSLKINISTTSLLPGIITPWRGIMIEFMITFLLAQVTLNSLQGGSEIENSIYPFPVALVIMVNILFAGSLTGASMNPARSFGPALVSQHWNDHYVYWIGPMFGAILSAVIHILFFRLTITNKGVNKNS